MHAFTRHYRLWLLLSCASLGAAAQRTEFGFFAGPQASSSSYKLRGSRQPTTWKFGGHIGAIARIPFEGNFYFTPSLAYSLKGFGVTLTDTSGNPGVDAVGNDIRLHTFELAPLFTIYFSSTGTMPFVQFGPAIDYAVFGTEDLQLKNGSRVGRTMSFDPDAYGRITASFIMRIGVETPNGLFFNAHYNYGLGSLNQYDSGPSIRHRIAGVSIGKIFRRRQF
jgi:hypothetical protein